MNAIINESLERMYTRSESDLAVEHTAQCPTSLIERKRANSYNPAMELIQTLFDTSHVSLLSPDTKGNLRLTCKHAKFAVDTNAQILRLSDPITEDLARMLISNRFPGLRELKLSVVQPDFDLGFLAIPHWPHLRSLQLHNLATENSEGLRNMLESAHWDELQELVLMGELANEAIFTPSTVAAMASAFPGLRHLRMQAMCVDAGALAAIVSAFPQLERLDLAHNTAPGLLSALATVPLHCLKSLNVAGVPMNRTDMYNMSQSPWFSNLMEFNACDDDILIPYSADQDHGVADLLAGWRGGPLRSLRLGPFHGLDALLEIRHADLPELQTLTLASATSMGSEVCAALSAAHLPALQELFLYAETCQLLERCTGRAWEGLGGLERLNALPNLTALHLLGMELTPAATEILGHNLLPRLRSLSLVCCGLSLPEVRALVTGAMALGEKAGCPGAPLLEELYLPGNGLDLWALAVLASAGSHFPALECLDLGAAGHLEGVGSALSTACAAGAWPRLRQLRCTFMGDTDAQELTNVAGKWPLQLLDVSPAVSEMVGTQLASVMPTTFVQWGI